MKRVILILALFCFSNSIFAQKNTIIGKSIVELKQEKKQVGNLFLNTTFFLTDPLFPSKLIAKHSNNSESFSARPMPKYYNYNELGVFCKIDVQLEKVVKFPVKFRLGEVQTVERKEGKY